MRALGLPHTYEAVRATADELPGVVAQLRDGVYDGLNVTVPHKERVLALVDALDESARGRRRGQHARPRRATAGSSAHNTDAPALAAELVASHRRSQRRAPASRHARGRRRARSSSARGAPRARPSSRSACTSAIRDIAVRARAFADPARRDAFVRTRAAPRDARALGASRARAKRARSRSCRRPAPACAAPTAGDAVASVVAWDALAADGRRASTSSTRRATRPWLGAARRRGLPVRRRPRHARAPGGAGARAVAARTWA